jgi:hypothetical protein
VAKRIQKPKNPLDWIKFVDPDDIAAAREEGLADAYGEDEEFGGLACMVENELSLPFSAKVLGQEVKVVGLEQANVGFALDMIVEHGGKQHRIDARSVELVQPLPEGAAYLAALLMWR